MSAIGPYAFTTMTGRLQAASSPTIPTLRGLKSGSRRPVTQPLVTTEEQTTLINAWIQALRYRMAVGAAATITDDGGVICPVGLICDVRCLIRQAVGAVSLVTTWSIMPMLAYADYGQASITTVVDAQGVTQLTSPSPAAASSTTIVIGGVTFTTCTGDLQWPISESQITAVSNGARAIGGATASARPDTGSGQIACAVPVADEGAGVAMMAQIRAMVGTYIDVSIGGVTISAVAVQDAAADWDETKVLPGSNTRLLQASFTLDVQDSSGIGGPAAEVQVATVWGNWQTVPRAWVEDAAEGLCGSVGHCAWTQDVGKILRDGKAYTDDPTDYGARWVRVRARTTADGTAAGGSGTLIGTTMTPIWWGEVLRDRIVGGVGQSATRTVTCGGLLGALAKCWPLRWYEQSPDAFGQSNPGEVLPFNKVPGGDGGGTGGKGLNGYTIHDRYHAAADGTPTPTPWTAHQLVDAWIAAFRDQYPQGPRPTITGQTTALDHISAWDLTMRDFGAGVIEVVATRWGLALRVEVDATTSAVTFRVTTGVAVDTVIPGLGTLPANDRVATVDLTGTDIISYDLVRAYETQVDHLIMWAGHPWYCMTFRFGTYTGRTTQFEKGWTADEEAAWLAANRSQRDSTKLSHVWRRWRLAADYTGGHAFNSVTNVLFKMDQATVSDTAHGTGGYSGEFSVGDIPRPRPQTVRFTREMPIWTAKDWAAITGSETVYTPTTPGRQHEGPILMGVTSGGVYSFLTSWPLQIEDDAAGVIIGNDALDAADIKTYLAGNNMFVLTIGVRYPLPWLMSWRRAQTERPRDLERCLVLPFPHVSYRQIINGTVLGLDSPTVLKQAQNDIRLDWETTVNSGVSKLSPLLALSRLRHENPAKSLTYTRRGIIDLSTATAPGSMISTATVPLDASRSWAETINLVRTGRAHHLLGGEIATSYTCEPLLPSLDRNLLAPPVPIRVLGRQLPYLLGGG